MQKEERAIGGERRRPPGVGMAVGRAARRLKRVALAAEPVRALWGTVARSCCCCYSVTLSRLCGFPLIDSRLSSRIALVSFASPEHHDQLTTPQPTHSHGPPGPDPDLPQLRGDRPYRRLLRGRLVTSTDPTRLSADMDNLDPTGKY